MLCLLAVKLYSCKPEGCAYALAAASCAVLTRPCTPPTLMPAGGDGSFMLTGVLSRLSVWELVHDGEAPVADVL